MVFPNVLDLFSALSEKCLDIPDVLHSRDNKCLQAFYELILDTSCGSGILSLGVWCESVCLFMSSNPLIAGDLSLKGVLFPHSLCMCL